MAHVNRRIGKSSETANNTADGTGGGVLDAFLHDYFNRSGNVPSVPGATPPPPAGLIATAVLLVIILNQALNIEHIYSLHQVRLR